jgi:hypothetical protein
MFLILCLFLAAYHNISSQPGTGARNRGSRWHAVQTGKPETALPPAARRWNFGNRTRGVIRPGRRGRRAGSPEIETAVAPVVAWFVPDLMAPFDSPAMKRPNSASNTFGLHFELLSRIDGRNDAHHAVVPGDRNAVQYDLVEARLFGFQPVAAGP